jgi:hypothetical protein
MKSLLVLVVLLTAGCATALPRAAMVAEEFPPTPQVRSLVLPFDAYTPSLADLYTIANAEDRLTRTCMTAQGLQWKVIARPTAIEDFPNRRRYGVIEMPIARDYGYHVPTGLLTPAYVEKLYDARDNSLTQPQKDAAYSETGCATEASRRFRHVTDAETGKLAEFDRKSLTDSQKTPAVAAAMKAWRECVGRSGYHYADPFAAISDARWWADEAAGPAPVEKAVAVADVGCKDQSGLIDAWHAAEVLIQQDMIQRNGDFFRQIGTDLGADVADARAVLAK